MMTLTLFNAYVQAHTEEESFNGAIDYCDNEDALHKLRLKRDKRERQRNAFEAAIRSRLAPSFSTRELTGEMSVAIRESLLGWQDAMEVIVTRVETAWPLQSVAVRRELAVGIHALVDEILVEAH